MVRELTKEEQLLIDTTRSSTPSREKVRRKRPKVIHFYQKIWFWVTFILSIPTILSIILAIIVMRAKDILGSGLFDQVTESKMTPTTKALYDQLGYNWIPDVTFLYNNRWIIVGVMYAIALFIILIILIIRLLRIRKLEKTE